MAKGITTVWTIESGSYSDHVVLAVFDDEDTAKQWCEAIKNDAEGWHHDAWVGSITFIEKGTRPQKQTAYMQNVELWDDGSTETKGLYSITSYPISTIYSPPPARPKVRYVRAPCHNGKGGRLEVMGRTAESVQKVVSDRMAAWKAGAWAGPKHAEIKED